MNKTPKQVTVNISGITKYPPYVGSCDCGLHWPYLARINDDEGNVATALIRVVSGQ